MVHLCCQSQEVSSNLSSIQLPIPTWSRWMFQLCEIQMNLLLSALILGMLYPLSFCPEFFLWFHDNGTECCFLPRLPKTSKYNTQTSELVPPSAMDKSSRRIYTTEKNPCCLHSLPKLAVLGATVTVSEIKWAPFFCLMCCPNLGLGTTGTWGRRKNAFFPPCVHFGQQMLCSHLNVECQNSVAGRLRGTSWFQSRLWRD